MLVKLRKEEERKERKERQERQKRQKRQERAVPPGAAAPAPKKLKEAPPELSASASP